MIHKLPYEIVAKIYGYLSIDEVTSVDITYREADYDTSHHGYDHLEHIKGINQQKTIFFKRLFEDRISMNLYLGQHFSDSQGLLKCMLINDIYISGSRALDYFVPGSTDENSDWDFYTGTDNNQVFRFMEFMKSIGIIWLTMIDWFTEKLEDDECVSGITAKQIRNLHTMTLSDVGNRTVFNAIYKLAAEGEVYERIHEEFTITVKNSKGKDKTFILRHDIYANFNIIYGTFNDHGKTQRVQLMIGTELLGTIVRFYTSAVQCVITGFCAAHMYAKDAYNRQSRLWLAQQDHPISAKKTRDSRKKYEKRGFMFYKSSLSTMEFPYQANVVFKRHLKDPDSHVIDYNIDGPWRNSNSRYNDSELSSFGMQKRIKFYEFSWIQNGRDLSVSNYHDMNMENAKEDALQQFMKTLADKQPDSQRRQQMLSALRELSSLTRQFRALGDPIQTILQSQETMPSHYLDQFVKRSTST
jgi:hypothetical protein